MLRRRRAVYKELWALQDVSFEVAEGQTFGLIGHNGSGKSTLLKCIAKILQPERRLDHDQRQDLGAARARCRLPPRALRPRQRLPQRRASWASPRRRSTCASTRSSSSPASRDRIDTPVKNYSSGMYVRLGFSVAINVDPDILLIDEILTVGDESFQRKCTQKFDDFKDSGKTIVIVSHGMGSMKDLCDEVALLDHGELVSDRQTRGRHRHLHGRRRKGCASRR